MRTCETATYDGTSWSTSGNLINKISDSKNIYLFGAHVFSQHLTFPVNPKIPLPAQSLFLEHTSYESVEKEEYF